MTTRTTVALRADLYDEARSHYQEWGFARIGDLLNAALGEYLQGRREREWDRSMADAASDPRYQRVLHQVTQDLACVDAEGLGPEY